MLNGFHYIESDTVDFPNSHIFQVFILFLFFCQSHALVNLVNALLYGCLNQGKSLGTRLWMSLVVLVLFQTQNVFSDMYISTTHTLSRQEKSPVTFVATFVNVSYVTLVTLAYRTFMFRVNHFSPTGKLGISLC